MFQPIGPNFLLSWIIAWKRQKPNNNFLYSFGFLQSFSSSSDMLLYVLSKFDLRPWGGYKVILIPFCNTDTGKPGEGIEVNHNLKSLCILSFRSSTNFYSSDIQLTAKWQFCSNTHPPFWELSFTILEAFLPWPWPKEIDSILLPIPDSSAKRRKSATGSEPADNTKIRGVWMLESL